MKLVIPALIAIIVWGVAQAIRHTSRIVKRVNIWGNLSANPYDTNSVNNPYGRYGSPYSADSIKNPYGKYGIRYSNDSANNPYATNAPMIYGNEAENGGYRY
jgi:hypothetical protein